MHRERNSTKVTRGGEDVYTYSCNFLTGSPGGHSFVDVTIFHRDISGLRAVPRELKSALVSLALEWS